MRIEIKIPSVENIEQLNQFVNSNSIKLVVFGESHGFFNDLALQEDLICQLSPKTYAYEMLEESNISSEKEFNNFMNHEDITEFSIISTYGELKPAVTMARNKGMLITGCDIKNMGRENRDFLKIINPTPEQKKHEKELMQRREKFMSQKLISLLRDEQLVFASLGAYHLRKKSFLWDGLENIKVLICYPTFKGQQKFGPTKGMKEEDILYILETKESYFNTLLGNTSIK